MDEVVGTQEPARTQPEQVGHNRPDRLSEEALDVAQGFKVADLVCNSVSCSWAAFTSPDGDIKGSGTRQDVRAGR